MKRMILTGASLIAAACISMAPLAQAKGSHGGGGYKSGYKSYSGTPKEHNVSGYTRKDGVYVAPHYRSNRDGIRNNNWTTEGNSNPHTGKDGTRPRSYYEKQK